MLRVNVLMAMAFTASAIELRYPSLRDVRPRSTMRGPASGHTTSSHSNLHWTQYHRPVREGWDEVVAPLLKPAEFASSGNEFDMLALKVLKHQLDKKHLVATGSTDVGMFDSGIGGLSVYKEFREQFPHIKVVFLADLEEPGYSKISSARVAELSRDTVAWLQKARGVSMTLVTCNLASNAMVQRGVLTDGDAFHDYPVIPITPPYGEFFNARGRRDPHRKAVGFFASDSVCSSGTIQNSIRSAAGFHIVRNSVEFEGQAQTTDCIGCRECHMAVDHMHPWANGPDTPEVEVMLRRKFKSYLDSNNNPVIDYLVFGCTHFPMLARVLFRIFGGKVLLVDPAVYQVKVAALFLGKPLSAQPHLIGQGVHDEFFAGVASEQHNVYERFKRDVEDTLVSDNSSAALPSILKAPCADRMGRAGVCLKAATTIDNGCPEQTVRIPDMDTAQLLSVSLHNTGAAFCDRQ